MFDPQNLKLCFSFNLNKIHDQQDSMTSVFDW